MADLDFNKHLETIRQEFEQRTADKPSLAPEQEKQIIKEIIQEKFPAQPVAQPGPAVVQPADVGAAAQPQVQTAVPNTQQAEHQQAVKQLIEVALKDGVERAVREANSANNPYLLDMFHDTLVDKFYSEIKSQEDK